MPRASVGYILAQRPGQKREIDVGNGVGVCELYVIQRIGWESKCGWGESNDDKELVRT